MNLSRASRIPALVWHGLLAVSLAATLVGSAPAAEDLGEPVTESVDGQRIVAGPLPFRDVVFSRDGKLAATTAGLQANLREFAVWDVEAGQKRCAFRTRQTQRTLHFSPDAGRVTVGIVDRKLTTLDTATGEVVSAVDTPDKRADRLEFSPNGKLLAIANRIDFGISLWDPATLESRGVLKGHGKYIAAMAFSPDGRLLLSCGSDHEAILWNTETLAKARSLDTGGRSAAAVAFSPDGKVVGVASNDTHVRVFVAETGELLARFAAYDGSAPQRLAISPDGKLIAIAGYTPIVALYRIEKTAAAPDELAEAAKRIAELDDDRFAVRQTATVRLVRMGTAVGPLVTAAMAKAPSDEARRRLAAVLANLRPPQPLRVLQGHRNRIDAVAFSPDGKRLATASHDGSVQIRDVATGETVAALTE
jgi:WD40 repeat protein